MSGQTKRTNKTNSGGGFYLGRRGLGYEAFHRPISGLVVGRLANEVCPRILGRVTDRGELW